MDPRGRGGAAVAPPAFAEACLPLLGVRHPSLRPDRDGLGAGGPSRERAPYHREDDEPGHWPPAALGRGTTVSSTCWRRVTFSLAMSALRRAICSRSNRL